MTLVAFPCCICPASFNGRMEALSEQYDFSQAERAVIASEVKALDLTEEAFASYKEKISQVWSHRDKEFIKAEAEKREAEIEEEVSRRLAERAQAYHNEEKMKAKDAKEEKDAKSSKSEEKMKAKEEKMKSKEEEEKAKKEKPQQLDLIGSNWNTHIPAGGFADFGTVGNMHGTAVGQQPVFYRRGSDSSPFSY